MRDIFVPRPFEGLIDEPEWIALRELVPAASAPLRLAPALVEEFGDRPATLATVLPMAAPAMTKPDGRVLIGLQRHQQSGDVSRDLAEALLCALRTEPGGQVAVPPLPGPGPGCRTSWWTARWRSPCMKGSSSGSTPAPRTTRPCRRRWSGRTRPSTRRSG
ncbi:hypothetical protein GCM10027614_50120 [Micromonospora vulcania]